MDKKKVLDLLGGTAKAAVALHIKPPSVSEWGDQIPFSAIGRLAVYQPKIMMKLLKEELQHKKAA